MQQLIDYIEDHQVSNRQTNAIWSMANSLIETEKSQIKDTYIDGLNKTNGTQTECAEQYYNDNFKNEL